MREKVILILGDTVSEHAFSDVIDSDHLTISKITINKLGKLNDYHYETVLVTLLDLDYIKTHDKGVSELIDTYKILKERPVIFITDVEKSQNITKVRQKRYHDDIIYKPIQQSILASKIKLLLELEKSHHKISGLNQEIKRLNQQLSNSTKKLKKIERHDHVTGLSNRIDFNEFLNVEIQKAKRYERIFAVLFMDLDNFKTINDSYGHLVGDKLLKHVSELIKQCIRSTDFLVRRKTDVKISRFGGDEFAIVLSEIEAIENAAIVANRILRALQEPLKLDKFIEVVVGMSIGIACYPFAGETINELCQSADMAMYDAKRLGKNTYCFYSDELGIARNHHIMIEAKLREALKNNQFYLLYQPILNLKTKKIVGIEALCRCDLKALYGVKTRDLIEIAEKTGLIHNLGHWVVTKMMEDVTNHIYNQFPGIKIHFNVSTKQLQENKFYESMLILREKYHLDLSRFVMELTETAIHPDARGLTESIKKFSKLGLETSIDDFGKGNASLIWLKYLDITSLKIDHEFVVDLISNENDAIITKSIIRLADNLELNVIAEGIETIEQLEFLIHHRCDTGQGHYFTPPLKIEALIDYLKKE